MAIMKHDMKAILGEDFFKEEVKCGYRISEAQKLVWAMQLDMYLVFSEICEKYGLKFFLMYGSVLGAVRHDGFIPWDDDIDVGMMRKDFAVFMKVAPKELDEPYALQCPYTYPNCFITNITMRNSMGTFTPKIFKYLNYNKGIPLDIFPIDYCDLNTLNEDRRKIYVHIMRCASWMKLQHPELLSPEQYNKCLDYTTEKPLDDWEAIQSIASNPVYDGNEYALMNVIHDTPKPFIYKSEWFEDTTKHKFETIEVNIPIGWDGFLRERYGKDYMSFPPLHQRGAINDKLIVNPYIPYKEFDFDNDSLNCI